MEMKLVYKDIEQSLDDILAAAKLLDPNLSKNVYGANNLEVTEQLDQLNHSLQQLLHFYQSLLIENEMSTRKSVQFMNESDNQIARDMELIK